MNKKQFGFFFWILIIMLISLSLGNGLTKGHVLDKNMKNSKYTFQDIFEIININSQQTQFIGLLSSDNSQIFGHNTSDIYVNINGKTESLSAAIEDKSIFDTPKEKSPAKYEIDFDFGELADNIILPINNEELSLQEAINEGYFFTGCYLGNGNDSNNFNISGASWSTNQECSYDCNCGKYGCSICSSLQIIYYNCTNGSLAVSEGPCT